MFRLLSVVGLAAVALVFASQAFAATTVPVSAHLAEPLKAGTPGNSVCPDIGIEVNCGSGEVRPFGHATEEVNIGVCGDTCNIREIDLVQGSIVLLETVTGFSCPGVCGGQSFNPPFALSFSEVVISGTGMFSSATGSLSGTLVAGGWGGVVQLAGTITLSG